MIYWDREAIDLVNKLRELRGTGRIGQTNSRNNGRFGEVHVYASPADKGKPDRAVLTCSTLPELRDAVRQADLCVLQMRYPLTITERPHRGEARTWTCYDREQLLSAARQVAGDTPSPEFHEAVFGDTMTEAEAFGILREDLRSLSVVDSEGYDFSAAELCG